MERPLKLLSTNLTNLKVYHLNSIQVPEHLYYQHTYLWEVCALIWYWMNNEQGGPMLRTLTREDLRLFLNFIFSIKPF
jgi:hypothetical protein